MKGPSLLVGLLLTILLSWPVMVWGGMRTFPSGSLVIPVDPCWQPVEDLPQGSGCAANGTPTGAAGAYGLAYRLQRAGVPVYLADDRGAVDQAGITLVISAEDQAPVIGQPGGLPLDPPPRGTGTNRLLDHLIDYRGQPFLLDARDLSPDALAMLAAAPEVRRHQVRMPFSVPVARVLTGLPTVVAAGDAGGVARLEVLLNLAGLAGPDGLRVVQADAALPPAGDVAVSACRGEGLLLSPFAGECGLPALLAALAAVPSTTVPRESVTTASVVDSGVLFTASQSFPGRSGHLRAYALNGTRQDRLWDAAEGVAPPGSGLPPASTPTLDEVRPPFAAAGGQRLLFTNLPAEQGFRLVTFAAQAAPVLRPLLGVDSVAAAAALINAVRGRAGTSAASPAGSSDRAERLGAISRSSPALVDGSLYDLASAERDQVLYVGGEDGLLHAIRAGRRTAADSDYAHTAEGCGQELWGYLPGSLLPALAHQPFADPGALTGVHVDGSPLVADLFIDSNGDGRREWRTLLVGTATAEVHNQGVVFALDVSDPLVPRLLWETALPGSGMGRSRGATLGCPGIGSCAAPRVFLTAATAGRIDAQGNPAAVNGSYGILACALDLADGRLLWQFTDAYPGEAGNIAEPPSLPSLMTSAANGGVDAVVFGDQAGRLWALDPASGAPLGDRPVWQASGGVAEPIGGGIAVRNRLVLFGTGGVEHADRDGNYAVYAVEILAEGGQLRWSLPLPPGERLWGAPAFDRSGWVYLALGSEPENAGQLLVLAGDGSQAGSLTLPGRPSGGLALLSAAVVLVTETGSVAQLGDPLPAGPVADPPAGRVRIFSWRIR